MVCITLLMFNYCVLCWSLLLLAGTSHDPSCITGLAVLFFQTSNPIYSLYTSRNLKDSTQIASN